MPEINQVYYYNFKERNESTMYEDFDFGFDSKKGSFNKSSDYNFSRQEQNKEFISVGEYILIKCLNSNENFIGKVTKIKNSIECIFYTLSEIHNSQTRDIEIYKIGDCQQNDKIQNNLDKFIFNPRCSPMIFNLITGNNSNLDNYKNSKTIVKPLTEDILNNITSKESYMNKSQIEAIKAAYSQRLTLIQGPPGTGKTTTAVEIIKEWLFADKNTPILVCADSNTAVDRLYKEIIENNIKAIRIGNSSSSEFAIQDPDKFRRNKNLIEQYNVICATMVSSSNELLKNIEFRKVICDEATQSKEITNLIPLLNNVDQLVLIGDHKQLPAVVVSQKAIDNGLAVSLFERLIKSGVSSHLLNIQYRMHPSISRFPNLNYYDDSLKDGITSEVRPIISGFNWPNKEKPICCIDIKGEEAVSGKSIYNLNEVEVIIKILTDLVKNNSIDLSNIGVITAYDAQKKKIIERILKEPILNKNKFMLNGRKRIQLIHVNTVDGFQGSEKELIIFSAVRSNDKVIKKFNQYKGFNRIFKR